MGFTIYDWAILALYFVILAVSGVLLSRRQTDTKDYFLARGSIPMWAAAVSLLATALSAATFIGGPQQAYKGDLTYLSANIGSIIAIVVVAVFFIPVFYKYEVFTVYQLLQRRFGTPALVSSSGAFLIGRIFASGARVYIVALPTSLIVFGDIAIEHQVLAVIIFTVISIFYTLAGGIRSVIWTDVIQTFVFVGAAVVGLVVLLDKIPLPLGEIMDNLRNPGEGLSSKLTLFKLGTEGFSPKHTYTILSAIFGFTLLNLGAYGTDQDMAQKLLTCKSARKGSQSALLGVAIGLPVTALFMFIGLLLYIFYQRPDLMGMAAPVYEVPESRQIFLTFIINELPAGLSGLMLAGLFAAGLSTLVSGLNSMSSSFTTDFYKRLRPGLTEKHYLFVGRLGVMGWGIIIGGFALFSIYWQAARPQTTMIDFALSVMIFAYSGLVAVFITALFTKRGNNISVIAALVTGFTSVVIMQSNFADVLAFPWQLTIATGLSFLVCIIPAASKRL